MKLRTRIIAVAVATFAMIGLAAAPAQAAYSNCDWGYVCIYTGLDGGGTQYTLRGVAGQCINMVGGGVDSADSYANRRSGSISHHVQFYDDFGCTGTLLHVEYWHGGPIPSGAEGNFERLRTRNYRNQLNSVFFNNG